MRLKLTVFNDRFNKIRQHEVPSKLINLKRKLILYLSKKTKHLEKDLPNHIVLSKRKSTIVHRGGISQRANEKAVELTYSWCQKCKEMSHVDNRWLPMSHHRIDLLPMPKGTLNATSMMVDLAHCLQCRRNSIILDIL